jgi:transposase-like protein
MIDNANNNEENEQYEVFKMDNVEPINDPNCKHFFVEDDDSIGDTQSWICKHCKRGVFYPKGVKIINS